MNLLLSNIKPGYLVPVVVIKALPDYNSYLMLIVGTEIMAVLPKKFTSRVFRVGDNTMALVHVINSKTAILTQKSAQYYRKITELVLSPLLQNRVLEVKRAACSPKAPFAKVAIRGLNGKDPIGAAVYYLKDLKRYTDDTITLVKYSSDTREFAINALSPAPSEHVKKVILFQTLREVLVKVDSRFVGLFLGKGGMNASLASKLIGMQIKIEPDESV